MGYALLDIIRVLWVNESLVECHRFLYQLRHVASKYVGKLLRMQQVPYAKMNFSSHNVVYFELGLEVAHYK